MLDKRQILSTVFLQWRNKFSLGLLYQQKAGCFHCIFYSGELIISVCPLQKAIYPHYCKQRQIHPIDYLFGSSAPVAIKAHKEIGVTITCAFREGLGLAQVGGVTDEIAAVPGTLVL